MSVTFPKLREAQERLNAKRDALAAIFMEAGPEYDMDKVKSLSGDSKAKVDEIRNRNEEINTLADEVATLLDLKKMADASRDSGEGEDGSEPDVDPRAKVRSMKSFGEYFTESKAFKNYQAGSGVGPVDTLDVELKTLFQTSAGWAPESLRTGHVELFATRPAPVVVDAIPLTTTGMAAIKYMEETTFTNNAAEASEGGTYAEGVLALTERSVIVQKIATFLPVTDEQFEDEQRSKDYVNNRLIFMLKQRLDGQIMTGDGNAPNLKGTENVTGIQTQALGADPIFDAAYKVFRKIRDDGFAEPSVFFIRAAKWESIALTRTADGLYILGNPGDAAPVRLWGVPGVLTNAVTSTKLVAGDYRNFSELSVRKGIDIQVTNAHSTFFIEGKLAIRADVRAALIHYRPKAFGTVTGL